MDIKSKYICTVTKEYSLVCKNVLLKQQWSTVLVNEMNSCRAYPHPVNRGDSRSPGLEA